MSDPRLRAAWALLADSPPNPPCPDPERLYDAVQGALDPVATAEVVEHLRTCGPCSADWRLAREFASTASPGSVVPGGQAAPRWGWWVAGGALALAAALLLTVRVPLTQPDPWRAVPDEPVVAAAVPDGASLDRDTFTLRWTGPADARFVVHLSDESLRPLYVSEALVGGACTVPAAALQGVPAGAELNWQVETLAADGTRSRSPTFLVRLGSIGR